jgi:hypothetical protein
MFIVQAFDYEEGSGARWNTVKGAEFLYKESARLFIQYLRNQENPDMESMITYRVVVKDSPESYSQPTDKLE